MQIRFHLHEAPTIVRFTELESATVVPGAEEREWRMATSRYGVSLMVIKCSGIRKWLR